MPHANTEIRALAEQWIQAWDARDLDGIMRRYSQDVDFEANTVVRRWVCCQIPR
jgi:ketosteroid isomerase-like protein